MQKKCVHIVKEKDLLRGGSSFEGRRVLGIYQKGRTREKGARMFEEVKSLLKLVEDINSEIQSEIEDVSIIPQITLDTDGEGYNVKVGHVLLNSEMDDVTDEDADSLEGLRRHVSKELMNYGETLIKAGELLQE